MLSSLCFKRGIVNNKNKLLIHTHLGLGDHFICNGLIRHIIDSSNYNNYTIPSKIQNYPTIKRMYCDLDDNVDIMKVNCDSDVYVNLPNNMEILRIGFEHMRSDLNFDEAFYDQLGLPLEIKRKKFKLCRDFNKEQECFNFYDPPEKYIFVHDQSSVGKYNLKIKNNLPQIRPTSFDFTLMDYLTLIEKAEEIHCIDSSFLNMIDLSVNHAKMYFHQTKKTPYPSIEKKWKLVQYEKEIA